MAEAIVGATVDVLLQNLIAFSVEEIGLIWNFTDDLKSLKDSVAMIRSFLEDAEKQQVADKSVQRWLMKLEAVAFDADYVFDQLNYQLLRKKVQRGNNMKKKVRCFFPNSKSVAFRYRMAREIKNIRDELKSSNQMAKELGLQERQANAPARGVGTNESNAYNMDPVFVGRENDATKVVEMVNNSPTDKAISVIPIVGMGGLGKTTLARKVFHDDSIISRFENRIWVYVSENFVQNTVFKSVFASLTGKNIDGSDEVVETGSLRSINELGIGGRLDCGDYVSFDRIFPAFQSLRELRLYGMEEWDGLPEQLQHLTTLHDLSLEKFGIEVLPEWLERLSSLRRLELCLNDKGYIERYFFCNYN